MYKIRAILTIAISFFIGVGIWHITDNGYLQRWEKLPLEVQSISQHFALEEGISSRPTKITKPCDYSMPEFSWFSNSPKNIVDCVQKSEIFADGYLRFTSALDNKAIVWEWKHMKTANESIRQMICFPSAGLIIGVLIAVLTKPDTEREKGSE
jgi:hypothetical protein